MLVAAHAGTTLQTVARGVFLAALVLLLASARARADFEQTTYRGEDGTAYQVLRFTGTQDAEVFRVTMVAGSAAGTGACVGGGGASGAKISATGGALPSAGQSVHPFGATLRTAILVPNNINYSGELQRDGCRGCDVRNRRRREAGLPACRRLWRDRRATRASHDA